MLCHVVYRLVCVAYVVFLLRKERERGKKKREERESRGTKQRRSTRSLKRRSSDQFATQGLKVDRTCR